MMPNNMEKIKTFDNAQFDENGDIKALTYSILRTKIGGKFGSTCQNVKPNVFGPSISPLWNYPIHICTASLCMHTYILTFTFTYIYTNTHDHMQTCKYRDIHTCDSR